MESLITAFYLIQPEEEENRKYSLINVNNQNLFQTKKGNSYSPEDTYEFIGFVDGINFNNSIYENISDSLTEGIRVRSGLNKFFSKNDWTIEDIINSSEIPIQIKDRMRKKFDSKILDTYLISKRVSEFEEQIYHDFHNSEIKVDVNVGLSFPIKNESELKDSINQIQNGNFELINTFERKYMRGFNSGLSTFVNIISPENEIDPVNNELISYYNNTNLKPGFTIEDILMKLEKA